MPRTRLFHASFEVRVMSVCVSVAVAACGGGGGVGADGGLVSFSNEVLPVFQAKCTGYCHPGSYSPMSLGSTLAHQNLVNAPSIGCTDGRLRVAPGEVGTQASYLMAKLRGVDLCGKSGPMPPAGGTPLTPQEIDLIGTWVSAGAPNN